MTPRIWTPFEYKHKEENLPLTIQRQPSVLGSLVSSCRWQRQVQIPDLQTNSILRLSVQPQTLLDVT